MVAQAFNPSTREAEAEADASEFLSSRPAWSTKATARATQRNPVSAGCGDARLSSQHLGGRGMQIYEFEASLVYRVSSRTAMTAQKNLVSEKKNFFCKKENSPFLSHATFSMLFNKYRTKVLVGTGNRDRHTQQTDNRYATDHKPQKWKTQGEGCRIPAWLASGLTIPRGS